MKKVFVVISVLYLIVFVAMLSCSKSRNRGMVVATAN